LFGHEAGAFTGAAKARAGKIEHASGGTLFLDEIDSMPLATQGKLLRVLQERTVERLGSNHSIAVDLRPVAASKADLRKAGDNRFRPDLYYRLSVVEVTVPPLRERKEDIRHLVAHILARRRGAAKSFAGSEVRYPTQITAKAVARLESYRWPGNIRELENVLSRAAILCDGEIIRSHDLDMLGLDRPHGAAGAGPGSGDDDRIELPPIDLDRLGDGDGLKDLTERAVRAVERAALAAALRRDRNPALAARRLGISRASIYTKMKTYSLGPDGSSSAD
jgi:DNA-binding NtrC family response regulator